MNHSSAAKNTVLSVGSGWVYLYLSLIASKPLVPYSFSVSQGLSASSASQGLSALRALVLKTLSPITDLPVNFASKCLWHMGLCFTHIAVGDGCLVYVPGSHRKLWPHAAYVRANRHLTATLQVPCSRSLDIHTLPSRLDVGCYARRVVTGHDCFGVACRALRMVGHDVSRWRGPVALFEYLNGLEGLRHETHRLQP